MKCQKMKGEQIINFQKCYDEIIDNFIKIYTDV